MYSLIDSQVKHAYCIIADHQWNLLQKMINCMDDERNDIYLHIDAKSLDDFHRSGGVKTKFSDLFLIDNPIDVEWSDVSLCDAEVKLFGKVLESGVNYQYVHLLSGSDLPVMNQGEIHAFFANRDEEFINVRYNPKFEKRIKYYHFFVRGRRKNALKNFIRRLLLLPQWVFVNRLRSATLKYAYGSEWCSLTLRAVEEIVNKYGRYRYLFENSTGSDELYKQMILISSEMPFKYAKEGNLRYDRFEHGKASPNIISMNEYDDIIHSGCLFARKFQEGTEAYEKICQRVFCCK